jgi:hypothetical protein
MRKAFDWKISGISMLEVEAVPQSCIPSVQIVMCIALYMRSLLLVLGRKFEEEFVTCSFLDFFWGGDVVTQHAPLSGRVFASRPASAKPPGNELTHPETKLSEISGY